MPEDSSEKLIRRGHVPFAMTPHWLYGRASPNAITVYGILMMYADQERQCFPGRELIAERMGVGKPISTDTVDRAIRELKSIGAVVVERGKKHESNTYYIEMRDPRYVQDSANMRTETPHQSGLRLRKDADLTITSEQDPSNLVVGKPRKGSWDSLFAEVREEFKDRLVCVDDELLLCKEHPSFKFATPANKPEVLRVLMRKREGYEKPRSYAPKAKVLAPGTSFSNLTQEQLEEMDISNWGRKP